MSGWSNQLRQRFRGNSSGVINSVIMQTQATTSRDAYLNALLEKGGAQPSMGLNLNNLRSAAQALVKEQTFPSTRDEEWRFTDLSVLMGMDFQTAEAVSPTVSPLGLSGLLLPADLAERRLVFINGIFAAELSSLTALPETITVSNLAALYADPDWQPKLDAKLAQIPGHHEVFTALNTASFADVAVVWVPRNVEVDQPIHLVHIALPGSAPTLTHPRCLIVAEANSALTLVEEFSGVGADDYLTNSVTEIWLDDAAQVNHTRLQQEQSGAFHIGKTAVSQARDSRYVCNTISLGAGLSRHNLEIYQTGAQTDTRLYGLSAIAGNQHSDTHSAINLNHPHGTAEQIHKCIVDDRAHAVFNGKVFVPREAQLTNASQLNRNLLLSDKARVDTKPQLEIIADNVKCAHGATVSQLEADEIFYLQSRGISAAEAQRLLLYGFAMEVVEKIPIPSIRDALTTHVTQLAS